MVRNAILRIPLLRTLLPRVSRPLLPLTRLAVSSEPRISLTRPGQTSARLLHHSPTRLSSSSPPPSHDHDTNADAGLPPNATLSQRLKHLIKAYGWYALGVYIVLCVADFSVAFAAVNIIGAEHAARLTASIKEVFAGLFPAKPVEPGRDQMDSAAQHTAQGGSEGIWAMVVLAYTIHKTLFFPVRVGLTAATTPRLVGWLRSRGWAGSSGTKRAAQEMRERIRNRRDRD
jgi:N-terminal acetyltransferase 2